MEIQNVNIANYVKSIESIAPNRYFTTQRIDKFPPQMISQIIAKYLLFTELENIPGPEQIAFLSESIQTNYPAMEIGELIITMKNGISGVYGPIYNAIRIDTVNSWIKGYYDKTWPEIEAKAAAARQRHKTAEFAESKAVPMPDHIKEAFRKIEDRVKVNKKNTFKKPVESKLKYHSLEFYCKVNGIEFIEFMIDLDEKLRLKFEDAPDMEKNIGFDLFKAVECQKLLAFYNSQK